MKIKLIDFGYNEKPVRKHYNDTGADVYLLNSISIAPHETKVIPCGFGIDLPDGYNAHFQTRTSIAKRGVFVQQCAIDAGYKGELHMIVTNMGDISQEFLAGERIAYLEVYPIVYADFVEDLGEERGTGAFGSTNNMEVKNGQ